MNNITSGARAKDNFEIPTAGWLNLSAGTFLASAYGELNSNQTGYARIVGAEGSKCFLGFHSQYTFATSIWNGTTSMNLAGRVRYPTDTRKSSGLVRAAMTWDQSSTFAATAVAGNVQSNSSFAGNWTTTKIYPGGSGYNPLGAEVSRITYFATKKDEAFLKGMSP